MSLVSSNPQHLAQEMDDYLQQGWSCPPDARRMMAQAVKLLRAKDAGSLRSEPSAAGRVWTHDDLEPAVNSDLNFPAVVDKHGVRWVADERHDGFTGWRTDSHGLVVWRTWFDLAFNRGPLHEVVRDA